eukprot:scaffold14635_cov201-Amphora_coffeaeformis.AAC.4
MQDGMLAGMGGTKAVGWATGVRVAVGSGPVAASRDPARLRVPAAEAMVETGGGLWGRLRVKVAVTGPRAFRQGWKEARDAVVASMVTYQRHLPWCWEAFLRSAVLKETETGWPVGLRKLMAVWETPGWPGRMRALRMAVQMIWHSVSVAPRGIGRSGEKAWTRAVGVR